MHIRNIISSLVAAAFLCTSAVADQGKRRNYIFWPVNMKLAHEALCPSFVDSGQTITCRQEVSGALQINFISTEGTFGIVYFLYSNEIEFIEVSDGQIFFFERLSGGVENSRVSARKVFCISTQSGNRGYSWNGSQYEYYPEATEECPIGREEWPWGH